MLRKRGVLIIFFLLFLFINIKIVNSGCCLDSVNTTNWCTNKTPPLCPQNAYINTDCSARAECMNTVCCLLTGPTLCQSLQGSQCPGTQNQVQTYDGSCNIPECDEGCCQKISQGTITDCFDSYKIECISPNIFSSSSCSENKCSGNYDKANITGYVKNVSGSPLQGATVYYEGFSTTTNTNGFYSLVNIPAGTRYIKASKQGYQDNEQLITVPKDITVNFNFTLNQSQLGSLEGYVKDSSNNKIPSALVSDASHSYYTYTNTIGYYSITNIPIGTYQFTASKQGYNQSTAIINIQAKNNFYNFTISYIPSVCGDGNVTGTEECDYNNASDPYRDTCKSDCTYAHYCSELGGQCAIYNWQCTENSGSIVSKSLDCDEYNGGYNGGCCNKSIIQLPQCHISTQGYDDISYTDTSTSHGICECAGQPYNTSVDRGFCCNSTSESYSTSPCLRGSFYGTVNDSTNHSKPVGGATLTLSNQYFNLTGTSGIDTGSFIFLQVPVGNYNLTITASGYYPKTNQPVTITSTTPTVINYFLDPYTGCNQALATPQLDYSYQKGVLKIKLDWDPYVCDAQVDEYMVLRKGETDSDFSIIGTTTNKNFDDTNLEWGKYYQYKIEALPKLTINPNLKEVYSNVINVFSGDELCEGETSYHEFCGDMITDNVAVPMIRQSCNESNQVQTLEECGPDSRCVEITSSGKTECREFEECSEETGNIFGLFYSKQQCEADEKFCYYDYSTYPSDTCKSCKDVHSCLDYLSQQACEENNCMVGSCKWKRTSDSIFSLGRGFCYDESSKSAEYCSRCGSNEDPFLNTGCTGEICSLIGSCYSNADASKCNACSEFAEAKCEDYKDKASCTGGTGFSISKCSGGKSGYSFTYSNDPCNLKVCKWNESGSNCFKDADSDNNLDCAKTDTTCQKDKTAPVTDLTLPEYINSGGKEIGVSVTDDNKPVQTYYCVGNDCCPTTLIDGDKIILPNTAFPLDGISGQTFKINFFSVDKYENTEKIRTKNVYVDTVAPTITIDRIDITESSTSTKSFVTITVRTSEKSDCSFSIRPLEQNNILDNLVFTDLGTTPITKKFNNEFEDGFYVLEGSCIDDYENNNHIERFFKVDRWQLIKNEYPLGQTYTPASLASGVILLWNATDDFYCVYQRKYPNAASYPTEANDEMDGMGIPSGGMFEYHGIESFGFNIPQASHLGLFTYDIKCYTSKTGPQAASSGVFFYIDVFPPVSSLYVVNGGSAKPFNESDYFDQNTILQLVCQDQLQDETHQSNCSSASAKICDMSQVCTQVELQPTQNQPPKGAKQYLIRLSELNLTSGVYNLCFNGTDNFNNAEEQQCKVLRTDFEPPLITSLNTIPPLTNLSTVKVNGTFSESSILYISIYITQVRNGVTQIVYEKTIYPGTGIDNTNKRFETLVNLSPGVNNIHALAEDTSGKKYEKETTAYYDLEGPVITAKIYNESYSEKTKNNKVEYGSKLIFVETAKDINWTNTISSAYVNVKYADATGFNKTFTLVRQNNTDNYIAEYIPEYSNGHYDMVVGNYTAVFYAADSFGNTANYTYDFEVEDKSRPSINITILDSVYNDSLGLQKVSYGNHQVQVKTSKPVKEWKYFNYTVKKGNSSKSYSLWLDHQDANNMTFVFNFTIFNNIDYANITGNNSEFTLKLIDINNKEGTPSDILFGRFFHTDTYGGDEPLIDPNIFDSEGNYYYNNTSLYLVGFTQPYEGGISVQMNLSKSTNSQITVPAAVFSKKIETDIVYGNFDVGSEFVDINDEHTNLTGLYVQFENSLRQNRQRYRITSAAYNDLTGKTRITLSPALEKPVAMGSEAYIYDKINPTGRFEFSPSLNFGKTEMRIYAIDEFGNNGKPLVRNFIADIAPPAFAEFYPDNSMVVAGQQDLSVLITDDSKINKNSISLTLRFNGVENTYTCSQMKCIDTAEGVRVNYTLPEDNGRYDALISAADMIGNRGSASWFFEVNDKVPKTPTIYVKDGIFVDNRWYVNKTRPTLGIVFDYRENITLTKLLLDNQEVNIGNVSKPNYYTWEFIPESLSDGEHIIEINAFKKLENGSNGPTGKWLKGFVVDTIAPDVHANNLEINEELVDIKAIVSDENPMSAELSGDIIDYKAELSGSNILATVFVNEVFNGNLATRNVNIKAIDKAGNTGLASVNVTVNKIPPRVYINNINQTYSLIPVKEISGVCTGTYVELISDDSVLNSAHLTTNEFRLTIPLSKTITTVYAACYDSLGNKAVSNPVSIIYDNSPPEVIDYSPRFNSGEGLIHAVLKDNIGIGSVELEVDGNVTPVGITKVGNYAYVSAQVQEGTHTAILKYNDTSNNTGSLRWVFQIDYLLPRNPAFSFENRHYFNTNYPYLAATFNNSNIIVNMLLIDGRNVPFSLDSCQSGMCKIVSTVPYTTSGLHRMTLIVSSSQGHAAKYEREFYVDTTKPEITITTENSTNSDIVEINGVVEDDNIYGVYINGVNSLYEGASLFRNRVNLTASQLNIDAYDLAENHAHKSITYTKDTTPPIINITIPEYSPVTSIPLKITSNEVIYADVEINGNTIYLGKNNTFESSVNLAEGLNIIKIRVRDIAGNSFNTTRLVVFDTINPDVLMLTPKAGNIVANDFEIRSAFNDDSKILSAELKIDGNVIKRVYGEKILYHNATLNPGQHTIVVTVTDSSGRTTSKTSTFTVSPDSPKIISNNIMQYYSGMPSFSITFDRPVLVSAKIEGFNISMTTSDDKTFTYSPQDLKCKVCDFFIKAVDKSDILKESKITYQFIIDNEKPEIKKDFDVETIFTKGNIIVKGTYKEENLKSIYSAGDEAVTYTTGGEKRFALQKSVTGGQVQITAEDMAGNQKVLIKNLILDTQAPSIIITKVDNSSENVVTTKELVILSGSVSDDHAVFIPDAELGLNYFVSPFKMPESLEYFNSIGLTVSDRAGNTKSAFRNIIKDNSPPLILVNPVISTSLQTLQINATTIEPATCYLVTPRTGTSEKMSGDNALQHLITKNILQDVFTEYDIICSDLAENYGRKSFSIMRDSIKPVVYDSDVLYGEKKYSTGKNATFVLATNLTTRIKAFANEEVRCKYGYNTDYSTMTPFAGYDSYSTTPETEFFTLLDKNNYSYYIRCEDRAGIVSDPYYVTIEADTGAPLVIFDKQPGGYTGDRNPLISVRTYVDAVCTAKAGALSPAKEMQKIFSDGTYLHYIHAVDNLYSSLEHNHEYVVQIKCEDISNVRSPGQVYLGFITDYYVAAPVFIMPQDNFQITNNPTIHVSISVENESSIILYVNNLPQTAKGYLTSTLEYDATLFNGNNTVTAVVTDKVGNTNQSSVRGTYTSQGPIVLYTIPYPGTILNELSEVKAFVQKTNANIDFANSIAELKSSDGRTISTARQDRGNFIILKINEMLFNGSYYARFIPKDELGNYGQGFTTTFDINPGAVAIILDYPIIGSILSKDSVTFRGRVLSYAPLKEGSLRMRINSQVYTPYADPVSGVFSVPVTLQLGENRFVITAEDALGNPGRLSGIIYRMQGGLSLECLGFYCLFEQS